MTISAFTASLSEAQKLIKNCGLFDKKGPKSISSDGVSDAFKKASYKDNYDSVYAAGLVNKDYDFILKDQSYFQFSFSPATKSSNCPQIRYAFFQNPREHYTYEEYLNICRQDGIIEDQEDDEIGDLLFEDYQQFLVEQKENIACTSIRYDVDLDGYRPLVHSVSHLHIGHLNHVRIPCNKIVTPLKFVLFSIKHIYYYQWKTFIEKGDNDILTALSTAKNGCTQLDRTLWQISEVQEFFLT